MNKKQRNLLIAGISIAVIIGVLSPFITSTQPDGLEKSADILNPSVNNNPGYWHAPFNDYIVSQLGNGPLAGIAALLIGVFIAFGAVAIITLAVRSRSNKKIDT